MNVNLSRQSNAVPVDYALITLSSLVTEVLFPTATQELDSSSFQFLRFLKQQKTNGYIVTFFHNH